MTKTAIKLLVRKNYEKFQSGDMGDLVGFVFNGILIWDPLLDETGRTSVHPDSYYGAAYRNSIFNK